MAARVEALESQRAAMRESYLSLLHYALRVVNLEHAVCLVLKDSERYDDGIDERLIDDLRDARGRLAEVVHVTPPDTGPLDLFARVPERPPSILLRGDRLEAFLALLRWVSGYLPQ